MRFLLIRLPALLVAGLVLWAGAAHADADPAAIAAVLKNGGTITVAGRSVDAAILQRIYAARDDRPIWDAERRAALTAALADAPSHGLDPRAFAVPQADPTATELLLTDAFVRYARALGRGLVTMSDVDHDWAMTQPTVDPAAVLARALVHGIAPTLAALVPQDAGYARLRQAYLRYRDYARHAAWKPIALALPLTPGASGPDVVKLRQRLAAEGLVPPGDSAEFDADLSAAVGRFQGARGLPASGVVALATLTALNIAPGARLRTIRLNLERRRAMPRDLPPTRIEVNVPGSQVVLYQDGQPVLTMRAVVGALEHPTPVLQTHMVAVTFNPPWVVPSSIIIKEIRPAIVKDPDYLKRHDYAYVDVPGGKQLIQRPGPQNALGKIKFEMPNRFDVYLHDTSRQDLMDRSRRALSHGCIRLDNPRELARRLLAGDSAWTLDAIDAAIATGKTRTVPLPKPIPVYVLYETAFADADGTVEFRNDIYDRDGRLDEALVARDLREQLRPPTPAAASHE
ncbi:MAG TPA: L,D-transpeptidase family protein [Stellaceae bacterium]|nr:L,D-transpeptidase family protein [Stellaceae bacterium]